VNPEALDDFLKSTCVIVVFAYLLTRRRFDATGWLIAIFGAVGLVELWVARERSPYDTYTLIITFAALRFGVRVGASAALIVGLGAPLFLQEETLARTWLALCLSLAAGVIVRRTLPKRRTSLACLLAITLAETGAIVARSLLHRQSEIVFSPSLALLKIAANGLGALLLQLVLDDALARQRTEELRVEVERGRTRLVESQLAALQARVHPHFLFNALTSIAALCRIAPSQAEKAIVILGQLMRRALESSPRHLTTLRVELEAVSSYLELEALRLGSRLMVSCTIQPECVDVLVPPFAVQTLVENAILHGISPCVDPAKLIITVRQGQQHVFVAVGDSGVGMEPSVLKKARTWPMPDETSRPHGIALASEQLVLLLGRVARLRVFSQVGKGTLVVFCIPRQEQVEER
jgi:sensor histidine kinase YesM